eukprot:Opistho-2@14286
MNSAPLEPPADTKPARPSLDYKQMVESIPTTSLNSVAGEFYPAHVPGRAVMAETGEGDAALAHSDFAPPSSTTSRPPSALESQSTTSAGSADAEIVRYTVQQNDTVVSIAVRFGITVWELCTFNRISSKVVFPGDVIRIPRPGMVAAKRTGSRTDLFASASASASASTATLDHLDGTVSADAHPIEPVPEEGSPGALSAANGALSHSSPDLTLPTAAGDVEEKSVRGRTGSAESDAATAAQSRTASAGPLGFSTLRRRTSIDVVDPPVLSDGTFQYHVKYITEGKGVVAGFLLMSPERFGFLPSEDDPLVKELGVEDYELDGPIGAVCNCSVHESLARIRRANRESDEEGTADGWALVDAESVPPDAQAALPMYLKVGVVGPGGMPKDHVFAVSRRKIDTLYGSLLQFMSDAEFMHGAQLLPLVIGAKAKTPKKRSFVDDLMGEDHPVPPILMQPSKLIDPTDMLKPADILPQHGQAQRAVRAGHVRHHGSRIWGVCYRAVANVRDVLRQRRVLSVQRQADVCGVPLDPR